MKREEKRKWQIAKLDQVRRATLLANPSHVRLIMLLVFSFTILVSIRAQEKSFQPARYDITFDLDFEKRTFTGIERIGWTNNRTEPESILYFHLYPNMRVINQQRAEKDSIDSEIKNTPTNDEPTLTVTEIKTSDTNQTLLFFVEENDALLRVHLPAPIQEGESVEVVLSFKGNVPEVDAEQTGIIAHVFQQVDAVLRSQRETRRARDINFFCKNVMMLGSAYPVLAVRKGNDWQRKVEASIGDALYTDAADYKVAIKTKLGVDVYASGEQSETTLSEGVIGYNFKGDNLRNFAFIAGKGLKVQEKNVGGIRVRSVYKPERESIGLKVLNIASEAVRIYSSRFGPLPYKQVLVVETPLVAGIGCVEFSSLSAIAGALYVDFDSPAMRNLPELIREQRDSVEDSLEWTVAHAVAQQWWGSVVGNDPQREPVLDEALSNWSALLYYKEARGEEKAAKAIDDQLRGVYKVYRTFGGVDLEANRDTKSYRNFFQYAAIVGSKGALMFTELRRLLGEAKFFAAITSYYQRFKFKNAELDDLKNAFKEQSGIAQQQIAVSRTFNRWLNSKRGDVDIAPPDPQLAQSLGISQKKENKGNSFARLGKFFWRQMTRIR